MKQVRKISNLVAEELEASLESKGVTLEEDVFESKVSDIVSMIAESVSKCDEEDDENEITEDDKFYMAGTACKLGKEDIAEGEFVEIEDTEDGKKATIYDENGDIRKEAFAVESEDVDAFTNDADEIDVEDDEEDLEEGFKKRTASEKKAFAKRDKKNAKKRDKKQSKEGYIRRKQANGSYKLEKMTSKEKAARKKIGKKLGKKFGGSNESTVTEGFDISANGMTISLEAGDVISIEEGVITVSRNGSTLFSGVEVSENFLDRCISEGVLEGAGCEDCDEEDAKGDKDEEEVKESKSTTKKPVKEEDEDTEDDGEEEDDEEDVDEAAMLTFSANRGYVLVREGAELPMGNRVRARATLASNGYNVTADILDRASRGELVTL